MNSTERVWVAAASIIGGIGLILGLVLIVLISPSPLLGLGVGVVFYAVIGLIIFFGLRSHRTRPLIVPAAATGESLQVDRAPGQTVAPFEVVLRESREIFRVRWFLLLGLTALIPLGASGLVLLEQGYSEVLGRLLAWVNGGWVLIALLVVPLTTSTQRAAAALVATQSSRHLRASEAELSIPIELVTEPALHIAVENGETEVVVSWKSIKQWHVSDGMGRAPPQHSLTISAAHSPYGGAFGRFGIRRSPEMLRVEAEFLRYASARAECELVTSASDVKL
jgi:hypothetical protein